MYERKADDFQNSMHAIYSQPGMKPDTASCYIFLRIHKTASYTLNNLVSREYRAAPVLETDFSFMNLSKWKRFTQRLAAIPLEERIRYRAIVGHMKFGAHELMPQPCRYITFLRDPVKRFVSYYYMLRQHGLIPPEAVFDPKHLDRNMHLHESLARELDNGQTRALANTDLDLPFGGCTEEHLKAAQANLDKYFVFVGFTERFNLSLMLLQRICGWRWHFYVPKNVTPNAAPKDRLSSGVLESIARLNRFDARLYQYAQQRFDEMVERHGVSLQLEHWLFASCNMLHRGYHHISYPLRKRIRRLRKGKLPA